MAPGLLLEEARWVLPARCCCPHAALLNPHGDLLAMLLLMRILGHGKVWEPTGCEDGEEMSGGHSPFFHPCFCSYLVAGAPPVFR